MPPRLLLYGTIASVAWMTAHAVHAAPPPATPNARISEAQRDDRGLLVHRVESEFQRGTTEIEVLLPDSYDPSRRYRVLYTLEPMEKGVDRFGSGLGEIRKHDLHNRHDLICVTPTYTLRPWYADHATNRGVRHESYLQQVVVPFIDRTYPTRAEPAGRLLVGFSKSGYGAFSLLLRHPEVYGRAAAFDASFLRTDATEAMLETFGDQQNFTRYQITRDLLVQRRDALSAEPRLCLVGYGNVRDHHEALHKQLDELGIPHGYYNDVHRDHRWDTGWIVEAVDWLAAKDPPH